MVKENKSYQEELWEAADKLRAQSSLKANEFSTPVLGLIFLKYADYRFADAVKKLPQQSGRSAVSLKDRVQELGVLFMPDEARYDHLLSLPESENIAKAVNDAMSLVEQQNKILEGVLPKNYQRLGNSLLRDLLKQFNAIQMDKIQGDAFGKIYEYFLGKFASAEGQRGGEFFTPTSLVRLIVEILKPIKGNVYDPACGSGGMFVQSSEFIKRTQKKEPNELIRIYGQEKTEETTKLCKMNLAVHCLEGDVVTANTMERDAIRIDTGEKDSQGKHIFEDTYGKMDFVMANPPFNVSGVDKEKIKNDKRYKLGLPKVDNANYLWIQCFYSALSETGRAGFVMPNSASDARQSEQTIREKIIKANAVDVMVSVGSNMFHNVALPCTLWFLDRGKKDTERKDKVLFLDVREIYTQVDRAHREFTEEQIEFITNIVKLYRGEKLCFDFGSEALIKQYFPDMQYKDVKGLCKVATIEEIEKQGWSLNSGRYVGVADNAEEDYVFEDKL
ncbi:MAG: N-6 DNA methylase, partial [Alphaproteobacteria bacterium]|nr:N-6 DNA methylase [Alphaproteobacteria bacterium]